MMLSRLKSRDEEPAPEHQWLCPRHRALIRHDAEAALALWQQLQWLAETDQLATPTLQLARWHVSLDVSESLLANGRSEALICLLAVAQALVPASGSDNDLLLRLHAVLSLCCEQRAEPPLANAAMRRALSAWLSLLEHRLSQPDSLPHASPGFAMAVSTTSQ